METAAILLVNALCYTGVLAWAFRRYRWSVGLFIWGLFAVSAWSSFFVCQHEEFQGSLHDNPQDPVGLIYLFVLLFLCISPMFRLDKLRDGEFSLKFERALLFVLACLAAFQILVFVVDIPRIENVLDASSLADERSEVYDDSVSLTAQIPLLNRLTLLYSGIKPIFIAFAVAMFFVCKTHRKLLLFCLVGAICGILQEVLILVSRGVMVTYMLMLGAVMILVRDFINPKTRKIILMYALPMLGVMLVFFWAISVSRFGSLASYMMFKYAGEPMINFAGILYPDMDEACYGHAYLLMPFYRDYVTTVEKWDYIGRITTIDASIFYTFIGGLVIEFGRVGAAIIALMMMWIENNLISRKMDLGAFIVWLFFIFLFTNGIFMFNLQGFAGLGMIVYTIFLYFLLRRKQTHEDRIVDIR